MSVRATAVHRNRSAICTAVPPPIAPPPLSGPGGFDKEDALVLAADAAAALIADNADGGDGGVAIGGGVIKDSVARVGTVGASGAGMTTMGCGDGDYTDRARAILHDDDRHPLGPPWRI